MNPRRRLRFRLPALAIATLAASSCGPGREPAAVGRPAAGGVPGNPACCPAETTFAVAAGDRGRLRAERQGALVSDDGRWTACQYRVPDEEGGAMVLLCEDDVLRGGPAFARAVAWEPGGTRLLCGEAAADDDLRHFVLDPGRGEYAKAAGDRLAWVIGGRGDVFRRWDGDTLEFENHFAPGVIRRVGLPPASR